MRPSHRSDYGCSSACLPNSKPKIAQTPKCTRRPMRTRKRHNSNPISPPPCQPNKSPRGTRFNNRRNRPNSGSLPHETYFHNNKKPQLTERIRDGRAIPEEVHMNCGEPARLTQECFVQAAVNGDDLASGLAKALRNEQEVGLGLIRRCDRCLSQSTIRIKLRQFRDQ